MNFGPLFSDNFQGITGRQRSNRRRLSKKLQQPNFQFTPIDWRWRAAPLACIGALVLLFLAGRLWQLQVVQGDQSLANSRNNSLALKVIPAPRGLIYDRNGVVLARNEPSFSVAITYATLPIEDKQKQQVIDRLAQILNLSKAEIGQVLQQAITEPFLPVSVKKNINRDTEIALLSAKDELPGISVEQDLRRNYPFAQALGGILGYTGVMSQQDQDKPELSKYHQGEDIGQTGIERQYETYLHGVIGKKFSQVNAQGQIQFSQNEIAPQAGNNIALALDVKLQQFVYDALMRAVDKYHTRGAAAILQDPKTGQVLSLVSAPGYDNNLFAKGIDSQTYSSLLEDTLKPLFNRAIAGTYPPGSTVKPLVAAGAIEMGVIKPNTIVYSPNIIERGGSTFADWTYWLGRSGPGNINAVQAIAQSTDTFFYKVGGGFEQQKGMGVDALYKYFTQAGLGSQTGIDLPGEAKGVAPNPAWKAQQFPDDPDWYVGNTYQLAIGQSYLLATPLQINVMTSAIANDGALIKPQLVTQIQDINGKVIKEFTPQVTNQSIAGHQALEIARQGMREGVTNGIIFPLRNNAMQPAAKTGTAEFGNRDIPDQYGTHSWITGYAPYNNPQISFTILLEGGGTSSNAAEVANEILDWYHREISPQTP